ncbi:FliH/SctL family protein [Cryobacterium sp. Y29]|uniref:FliH/SctL family protein n=1 Tax=Cryobacterium sp. Y29 TaxID=2048285 RepID=UPI0013049F86|nr:FliH/SctL family protein [Cryobacterium sp. Y29]
MSADTGFGRITFPRLHDDERTKSDETARAQGHAAGYAEGLRAASVDMTRLRLDLEAERGQAEVVARAKMDRGVRVLSAAADALNRRSLPVLVDAEQALITCALQLAEAIIGAELSRTEPSARRALDRAMPASAVGESNASHCIRMNPDDLAILTDRTAAVTGVTFIADPAIKRGDAIAEVNDGILDARIETALARATAILLASVMVPE